MIENNSLWLKEEPTVDEIIQEFEKYNLNDFKEVVFCGFGEPLIRHDDLMKVAKYLKERRPDLPTRVNTNGLSSLYNKRDITPEFKGLLDTVSISLNTSNKEDYLKLTRSQYGIDSFDELLDFAKKCKAYVPHVVLTIVDTTIPEKDVEICKQIAQNIGVTLRIRPFED
jgi:radical SAM protein, tatD family-associated